MQSLNDMLSSRTPAEPPQVVALKRYALEKYSVTIQVVVNRSYYLIKVPNAALAHKFRVDTRHIVTECELDKRLVIHIA